MFESNQVGSNTLVSTMADTSVSPNGNLEKRAECLLDKIEALTDLLSVDTKYHVPLTTPRYLYQGE